MKSWTSEIQEIWNSGHTYSNSYILLNFITNESFTIQKLPRSTWDLLRLYKTDHMQSNLPVRTRTSEFQEIWNGGHTYSNSYILLNFITNESSTIQKFLRSMWDLFWQYKTDHVQANLPVRTHDNASPDSRIWKLGPLTLDPQAWHWFRFAVGHHLLKHKASPYNEEGAHKSTDIPQ